VSRGTAAAILACYAIAMLFGYCRIVSRMPPRQRVPGEIQLLAWLGILAAGGAACFAVAFFLKGD
jgi:hypothetical protein